VRAIVAPAVQRRPFTRRFRELRSLPVGKTSRFAVALMPIWLPVAVAIHDPRAALRQPPRPLGPLLEAIGILDFQ
jgi:hypothetical protein